MSGNETILVTGGAGFIGSRLTKRLAEAGYSVRVLDSLHKQVHGEASELLKSVEKIAEVHVGSVTNRDSVERALVGVDCVVHLAAETGTGQSMYEVDRYVSTNVGGTATLLDVIANGRSRPAKMVVASSRSIYGEGKYLTGNGEAVYPAGRLDSRMEEGDFEVYGPNGEALRCVPTDEESRLHPASVYGITKLNQEQLTMTVCPTLEVLPVALRYQNVYGPGQSLSNPYTGILSIFSNLIRQGKPINVFEDGYESRDFVYIDDVVEATFLAIDREEVGGGTFNVGSGVRTSVRDVVAALLLYLETDVPVEVTGNFRSGDIRHNFADISLAQECLGFRPSVGFEEGVSNFVRWVTEQPLMDAPYEQSLVEMRARNMLK